MQRKERRKRKPKKKKITINSEYTKDEADVRALIKAREPVTEIDPNSDIEADFFCQVYNEENDNQSAGSSQANVQDTDSNLAENPTALFASAYVNIEDTSPISPAAVVKISKDADILFVPSNQKLTSNNQQKEVISSKDIELEGLFVDDYQKLEGKNVNRLVNRYLEEGFDGNLDNVSEVKKCAYETVYKSFSETHFEPTFFSPKPLHQIVGNTVGRAIIIVYIKELVFTNHQLFSEENKLALTLKTSFDTYNNIIVGNSIPKLKSELSTVRNVTNDLLKSNNLDKKKLETYINQIKTLRTELHSQERTFKKAILDCIDNWKQLKNLRKKQEFSLTSLKLTIKVIDKDTDLAQRLSDERFDTELNEMVREAFDAYYRKKKKTPKGHLRKPNIDDIKSDLTEMFERDLVGPDEPDVILELSQTEVTKKVLEKPKGYYIKALVDKKPVCCSREVKLSSEFILRVEETFAISLEGRMPEVITFQIFEKSNILPDVKVSEAQLFIPQSESFKTSKDLEFSSEKNTLSGFLRVEIFSQDDNFSNIGLQSTFNLNNKKLSASQSLIKNQRSTDSEYESIEPIDSHRNARRDTNSTVGDESGYFTFTEELDTFCSKADFDNNKRFKMLMARYKSEFKFKDKRFIPTFDKELEEESQGRAIEGIDWLDPIDVDKHKGKKYVKNIYQMVLNHCERLNRNEDAENLLIGDDPPTISSVISSLLGIFSSSRPLNPVKSGPPTVPASGCSNFNIIVNVVRATGVPYRQFASNLPQSRRDSTASLTYQVTKPSNVRPYISMRCKDKVLRTMGAEGSNPTWNEQLVLQLSREDLESKDDLIFGLYDEYIEDLLNDELARASEVYQRIHTNWLGELKLPLTTILAKKQIEGTFELDSPKILLGYTKPSLDTDTDAITVENIPEIKKAVYLSLHITIEPLSEMHITTMSHLECSELRELKAYIQEACIEVKENFPDRFIDPLISVANGKRVCMTRLLEPLPLPFAINEESESMVRRYVSLFPVFRSTSSCLGLHGVWFSNQIVLDSSWASPKDLGVLLCCYYLSLELPAALVLGIAYPYGDTTFVLLKQSAEYILIDPNSGKKYSSNDTFCPLIRVFCVVREDNIFFNIQTESRASMTDFNVDNKTNWLPLFTKKCPAPNGEIHNVNYLYREPYEINDLQKTIERKIIKKINSWRSNRKTIWNRAFKDMLYNVLIELERDALFDRDENVYMERIALSYPDYKMFGFTQNFSYTNLSSISDRVKATGIHLNPDKNVEFSLAVYIQQYPNNIMSVWVFFISVIPAKS